MPRIRDVLSFDDRTVNDLANVAMFVGIFLVLLGAFTSFLGYAHGLEWHFKEIGPAISGLGVMSIIMATVTYIRLYLKKKARRRPRQERYYNGDVYGHLTTDEDPPEGLTIQAHADPPNIKDVVVLPQDLTPLEVPSCDDIPMTQTTNKLIKSSLSPADGKKSWIKKPVLNNGKVSPMKPLQNNRSLSEDHGSMSSTTALYNENFAIK